MDKKRTEESAVSAFGVFGSFLGLCAQSIASAAVKRRKRGLYDKNANHGPRFEKDERKRAVRTDVEHHRRVQAWRPPRRPEN